MKINGKTGWKSMYSPLLITSTPKHRGQSVCDEIERPLTWISVLCNPCTYRRPSMHWTSPSVCHRACSRKRRKSAWKTALGESRLCWQTSKLFPSTSARFWKRQGVRSSTSGPNSDDGLQSMDIIDDDVVEGDTSHQPLVTKYERYKGVLSEAANSDSLTTTAWEEWEERIIDLAQDQVRHIGLIRDISLTPLCRRSLKHPSHRLQGLPPQSTVRQRRRPVRSGGYLSRWMTCSASVQTLSAARSSSRTRTTFARALHARRLASPAGRRSHPRCSRTRWRMSFASSASSSAMSSGA
jgi:hypothetical protein